jgi:hypothetical protein
MRTGLPEKIQNEKRSEPRRAKLRNYHIEIKLVGHPIYHFRIIDLTTLGAGFLIKNDSSFLNMVEKGQVIEANFISPQGEQPSGIYSAMIRHITAPNKSVHKGHPLVGISLLKKLR